MKHFKNIMRSIIFLSILVSSLLMINQVLVPKFVTKNSTWPTTSSFAQFYKMEKDSIDVLFLGSSVVVNAIIPQEIYNEYGIRCYNLGSEQQSIYLSYYWLKEALRYQKPKAVVLDLKFMFDLHPEDVINTTEGITRKSLDPMKWSSVKREAVHNLCEMDESQSELSYYLTNLRFHSRWSELQEYDINDSMVDTSMLKGFAPITAKGPDSYVTYDQNDKNITMEFVPVMQEYLDRIVRLCKEKNIQLILINLPGYTMNDAINNTHSAYAAKHDIEYYNLYSTEYYKQIGAELPEESVIEHENIWGAIKTSRFIGKILRDKYEIESVYDEQYETTKSYYEQTKRSSDLVRITDQIEYMNALNSPNYAVFMVAHGSASAVFDIKEVKNGLSNIGLKCKFTDAPENSYIAAIIGGEVVAEESSENRLDYFGSFRNRHSIYNLQSSGKNFEAYSSIIVEGGQYSRAEAGLNIAVYDLNTYKVIDKVTFQGRDLLR